MFKSTYRPNHDERMLQIHIRQCWILVVEELSGWDRHDIRWECQKKKKKIVHFAYFPQFAV